MSLRAKRSLMDFTDGERDSHDFVPLYVRRSSVHTRLCEDSSVYVFDSVPNVFFFPPLVGSMIVQRILKRTVIFLLLLPELGRALQKRWECFGVDEGAIIVAMGGEEPIAVFMYPITNLTEAERPYRIPSHVPCSKCLFAHNGRGGI